MSKDAIILPGQGQVWYSLKVSFTKIVDLLNDEQLNAIHTSESCVLMHLTSQRQNKHKESESSYESF